MAAEQGITSIYLACRGLMARAVRRIVGQHDVEDILQEAFVRSFEAEGRQTIRDARAFLMRTARNLALDHVSRAAYRTTGPLDQAHEDFFVDGAALPDAQVDSERRFLLFCQAVGGLPEQCRRVFGAVEDEAGGLVDRDGAGVGRRIGSFLAGVDGEGFGLVRHVRGPFKGGVKKVPTSTPRSDQPRVGVWVRSPLSVETERSGVLLVVRQTFGNSTDTSCLLYTSDAADE